MYASHSSLLSAEVAAVTETGRMNILRSVLCSSRLTNCHCSLRCVAATDRWTGHGQRVTTH